MLVVLDTNVLLSALISPHGAPGLIYSAWRAGRFDILTAQDQLEELRRASRYPKFKEVLQPSRVGIMINNLQRAVILEPFETANKTEDPDDDYLIGLCIAGNADYLVTGDKRAGLIKKANIGRARIATPSTFCEAVIKPQTSKGKTKNQS